MKTFRRALLCAAATTLTAGGLLVSPAAAAPAPLSPDGATTLAAALGADRSAGSFVDANGTAVVAVTDSAAADRVRASGGVAQLVTRSAADLKGVISRLDAGVTGTAWSVDPATNQVVIDVDTTVKGAALAKLEAGVAASQGAARIERMNGKLSRYISGGDAIYGGGYRCSLGFNVRNSSGQNFFITAGHCTNAATTWYANSSQTTVLGTRTGTSFPGNDYGIVRYASSYTNIQGSVGGQDITRAANPTVGQSASRRGSTTGTRSGSVTGLNATVRYAEGTVTGMIRTNICAQGGDSGGPLYSGSTALGLTSGGSGNCTFGGTTFFQPVLEVLNRYGVNVW